MQAGLYEVLDTHGAARPDVVLRLPKDAGLEKEWALGQVGDLVKEWALGQIGGSPTCSHMLTLVAPGLGQAGSWPYLPPFALPTPPTPLRGDLKLYICCF